jgi:hypothetical protein
MSTATPGLGVVEALKKLAADRKETYHEVKPCRQTRGNTVPAITTTAPEVLKRAAEVVGARNPIVQETSKKRYLVFWPEVVIAPGKGAK